MSIDCFQLAALYERTTRAGDFKDVRKFFNTTGVNDSDDLGWTGLMVAAQLGYTDVVKLMVEDLKADVDLKNAGEFSALTYGAQRGHQDIVQILLETGADVDVDAEACPLIWASRQNHLPVVECLVQAKAEVGLTDSDGKTALDWAKEEQHYAIIEYLCKIQGIEYLTEEKPSSLMPEAEEEPQCDESKSSSLLAPLPGAESDPQCGDESQVTDLPPVPDQEGMEYAHFQAAGSYGCATRHGNCACVIS